MEGLRKRISPAPPIRQPLFSPEGGAKLKGTFDEAGGELRRRRNGAERVSRRAGSRPGPRTGSRTGPRPGGEHAPGGARRNREKGTEGPRSPEVVFRKPFRRRLPVKVVRRQPSPNPFPGGSSPETGPRKGADEGRFALAVPGLVNALPKRPPASPRTTPRTTPRVTNRITPGRRSAPAGRSRNAQVTAGACAGPRV